MALTARSTAVSFLAEQLGNISSSNKQTLQELLLRLFQDALQERHDGLFDNYQPVSVPAPTRHAAYSANLVLLIVLIGGEITTGQLYPSSTDAVNRWRQAALLWRSQLTPEGWNGLVHTLKITRGWDGDRRSLSISLDTDDFITPDIDPYWSYSRGPASSQARWFYYGLNDLRRHSYFICDTPDDTVFHAMEPFAATQNQPIGTFHAVSGNRAISSAQALLTLWSTAGRSAISSEQLADAHEVCLTIALQTFYFDVGLEAAAQQEFCELAFRQLVVDQHRLPQKWLSAALERIRTASAHSPKLSQIAYRILDEMLTKRFAVAAVSEAEISEAFRRYISDDRFTKASYILMAQRILILSGAPGSGKRTAAIALLRQATSGPIMLFPPTSSQKDIVNYKYQPDSGYAIIDWRNGSLVAQKQDFAWPLHSVNAYLVATISVEGGPIPNLRWEPPHLA